MIKVITNRAPAFLKAAYANPDVDLQNHHGFIQPGERYIEWDGGTWIVQVMLPERVPRFVGKYGELTRAMMVARK